jgi:curved DNA-binding protein CbpA
MKQPHEILGVARDATPKEIEIAFKRLAMQHHPDRGGDADVFVALKTMRDLLLSKVQPGLFDDIFEEFRSRLDVPNGRGK